MQNSKQLMDQVEQKIGHSPSTSQTEAGPTDSGHQKKSIPDADYIDAINQVFTLFMVNYHNQFYAAFGDTELLNQAKKLWLESLSRFSPEQILRGAKSAIEKSEYLPTLHKMIEYCKGDLSHYGLPSAHSAYVEACRAPSPKAEFHWSHPAVYHAGLASDWLFLGSNPEHIAFPVFKENYSAICAQVLAGAQLALPRVPALPDPAATPLSKAENKARLDALRKQLDL